MLSLVWQVGFQRKGARGVNLVDVPHCPIATPEVGSKATSALAA